MSNRLEELRFQIQDSVDLWQANVANPYIRAYNAAYKSYTKTYEDQKESDKVRIEMFVAAASVLPGSFLMATAATGSMRTLANRLTMRALATANLTRMLGGYNAATRNATVKFAIGALLDAGKDQLSDRVKAIAVKAAELSDNSLTADPLDRDKHLDSFFKNLKVAALDSAREIEQAPISEAEKNVRFAKLRASPIASRPTGKIEIASLAPKIELGLYMMTLLESDYRLIVPAHAVNPYGAAPPGKRVPIDVMPKDLKNYPKPTMPKIGIGYVGESQSIGIDRPGGDVEDRIDVLSKQVRNVPFYAKSGWFGKDDRLKSGELRAAQDVLDELSKDLSPLTPLGLKS